MFLVPSSSEEDEEPPSKPVATGTRSFPSYDIKKEPTLAKFVTFLMTIDGKARNESTAISISRDVSKYLKFACGDGLPQWNQLTNRQLLSAYIDKLKSSKMGASGIVAKLDSIEDALRYYRVCILDDEEDSAGYNKSKITSDLLQSWRKVFRREREKRNTQLIEEQSESSRTFEEATNCVRSEEGWRFFDNIVKKAKVGCATPQDFDTATHFLAHCTMADSGQRTGAVTNMTVMEWERAQQVGDMLVVRVVDHKTSQKGTANIILSPAMANRMKAYLECIRPNLLSPNMEEDDEDLFFLQSNGTRLNHLAQKVSGLAKKFGFTMATSTQIRKSASTDAAHLPHEPRSIVTKQMSHSIATAEKHYALVRSAKDSVQAYDILHKKVPAPPKRKKYTPKEEQLICSFFEEYITEGSTPKLPVCARFLELHPLEQRTPKNIQDKVRGYNK